MSDTSRTLQRIRGTSHVDQFIQMRHLFRELRGADRGPAGSVPRTTLADAVALVDYWRRQVDQSGIKDTPWWLPASKYLGGIPGLVFAAGEEQVRARDRRAVSQWQQHLAQLTRALVTQKPGDVYAHNADLWRASFDLASHLDTFGSRPSAFERLGESLRESVSELPDRLKAPLPELPSVPTWAKVAAGIGAGSLGLLALSRIWR